MFDISGRAQVLRKEVGELKLANQLSQHNNDPSSIAERQRREVRLRDIQLELMSLTRRLKGKQN